MIASSTTMPMASVSARSVKLLIEKPMKYMIANVATMDVGIARPGMIVARRLRRKMKMMITTSRAAISRVSSASLIERLTNIDWSKPMLRVTPGGSEAWILGSSALMASDTEMIFDFDWRTTPIAIDWMPLKRNALRSSSGPSSTRPKSLSLTRMPSVLLTARLPNSSGVLSSPKRADSEFPALRFDAAGRDLDIAAPDSLLDVLNRETAGRKL